MKDIMTKLRILKHDLAGAYTHWKDQIWSKDLDELYCCSGIECGCDGISMREAYRDCAEGK